MSDMLSFIMRGLSKCREELKVERLKRWKDL